MSPERTVSSLNSFDDSSLFGDGMSVKNFRYIGMMKFNSFYPAIHFIKIVSLIAETVNH